MNIGVIGIGVLFAVMASCSAGISYGTIKTVSNVTITDKERIVERSGESTSSKYLVFTDTETFENTDSLWHFKFDSSDIYGKFQPGQVCDLTVTGFRVSFMSMYRNILEVDCQ